MKILFVGDYHGTFPSKIFKIAKDVDLVVSLGDYPPWELKKVFFEKSYRTGIPLWKVVGKKKYRTSFLKDWKIGEKIMEKLNSLKCPVLTVGGNYDSHNVEDSYDVKKGKEFWEFYERDFFSGAMEKYSHINRIDYRAVRVGDFVFVGAYGSSFPGRVKSKAFRKHKKKLDDLFKKYRRENLEGKLIFVSHNVPYDTKLDKIKNRDSPMRGKHYGSKLVRRIINRHQMILSVAGHMHENQGKDKIGKTLVINSGAAVESKAVLVDLKLEKGKGKIKSIKFLK